MKLRVLRHEAALDREHSSRCAENSKNQKNCILQRELRNQSVICCAFFGFQSDDLTKGTKATCAAV